MKLYQLKFVRSETEGIPIIYLPVSNKTGVSQLDNFVVICDTVIIITTIYGAISDDKVIKMAVFVFNVV